MSFENATPGQESRGDAQTQDRLDGGLGWLSAAGAPVAVAAAGADAESADDDDAVLYEEQVQPETGLFGFTLRELVIVGAWLVAFVVSFFPLGIAGGSIWTSGIGWVLTIGVQTIAVFLVVLRRLSPDGIRRVGSLGIDQFASVAATVSAVAWAQLLWSQAAATIHTGLYVIGWVVLVSLLAALGLVAATVAAPLIPGLREDFEGRMETLAHRNANPVRPVVARVRAAAPAAASTAQAPQSADEVSASTDIGAALGARVVSDAAASPFAVETTATSWAVSSPSEPAASEPEPEPEPEKDHYTDPVGVLQDIFAAEDDATAQLPVVADDDADTTRDAVDASVPISRRARSDAMRTAVSTEPFWVLAMTERDVYDEHGQTLFRVGPTAWTLVIEDRGGAYVVRHEDGRIGYLHDISDITKG